MKAAICSELDGSKSSLPPLRRHSRAPAPKQPRSPRLPARHWAEDDGSTNFN